jgi:ABC-type iron transport system FetAB permease component
MDAVHYPKRVSAICFLLVSFLAYSSPLKMEAVYSSEIAICRLLLAGYFLALIFVLKMEAVHFSEMVACRPILASFLLG